MKTHQERMYENMMRHVVQEATQEAEESGSGIILFRNSADGTSPESVETLRTQAQAAESIIGRYGVTVWSSKSLSPETTPHASMSIVERFFRLENTPPNSEHYTLYFRKPVDLLQADKFNLLFYDQFTPERDVE